MLYYAVCKTAGLVYWSISGFPSSSSGAVSQLCSYHLAFTPQIGHHSGCIHCSPPMEVVIQILRVELHGLFQLPLSLFSVLEDLTYLRWKLHKECQNCILSLELEFLTPTALHNLQYMYLYSTHISAWPWSLLGQPKQSFTMSSLVQKRIAYHSSTLYMYMKSSAIWLVISNLKFSSAPCDKKYCSEHQTLFACTEGLERMSDIWLFIQMPKCSKVNLCTQFKWCFLISAHPTCKLPRWRWMSWVQSVMLLM